MPIRLLISVRDAQEAALAADSGADIIDVKEPNAGSLGFAGTDVITEITNTVAHRCKVSAALGECVEWKNTENDSMSPMAAGLSYVKIGLAELIRPQANLSADSSSRPHAATPNSEWKQNWAAVRQHITERIKPVGSSPRWVAVAYADHLAAGSPEPAEILAVAAEEGCAGFLIDTWQKGQGTTLDLLSEETLRKLRSAARESNLFFALAGQLTQQHLPHVRRIAPDILAVRGAVCSNNDRRATVSGEKIRQLKMQLNSDENAVICD